MSSPAKFIKLAFRQRLFLGGSAFILFAARVIELFVRGETAHVLWVCHMSSLLIALGLFLDSAELVRISVLWLIIGAPLWPVDIIRTGIMELTSFGTHYAGLVIGLLALRHWGMGRLSWLYALIWFLLLQQLARRFTPAEFNINLAHSMYPGWEQFFSTYRQYWIFTTAGSGIGLWSISRVLSGILNRSMSVEHG